MFDLLQRSNVKIVGIKVDSITNLTRNPTDPSVNIITTSEIAMLSGTSRKLAFGGQSQWSGPNRVKFGPLYGNTTSSSAGRKGNLDFFKIQFLDSYEAPKYIKSVHKLPSGEGRKLKLKPFKDIFEGKLPPDVLVCLVAKR